MNPFYSEPAFNSLGASWVDQGLGGYLKTAGYAASVYEPALGMFKVPTLRNVGKQSGVNFPKAYGHNGYFKSLEEVVHFYNTRDTMPWPAPEYAATVNTTQVGNLGLTPVEEKSIVAFLNTLSDVEIDTLSYTAGAHGSIAGSSTQTVNSGSDGTAVTAVPDTGYHFVSWSDGVTSATRTDTNVKGDVNVTANFALNTVAKSLTINGPNRAKHGYAFKLYGKVTPIFSSIQITRYRYVHHKWVSYGRYNQKGRYDGTWIANVSTNHTGSWKFIIRANGLSATRYVTAY
jgi:hypothetical protein